MLLEKFITIPLITNLNLKNEIETIFKDNSCIHIVGTEHIINALIGVNIAFVINNKFCCKPNGYIITSDANKSLFSDTKMILVNNSGYISPLINSPNTIFRISGFNCPPYLYYNKKLGFYDGIEKDIIDYVTSNWKVEYKAHPERSWNEIVDEVVVNHTSDIATCSQWDIKGADVGGDMPFPYGSICATFMVPKAKTKTGIVYQGFQTNVWILILASIVLTSLVYQAMLNTGWLNYDLTLLNVIRICFLITLPRYAKQSSINVLLISWWFTALLIGCGYSAGFASFLTSPPFYQPLQTYEGVLKSDTPCYDLDGNYTKNALLYSANPSIRNFGRSLITITHEDKMNENCYSAEMYNSYVVPEYAYHNYSDKTIKVLPQCFGLYTIRFILQKGSPYTKPFDKAIKRFMEHGLINARFEQLKYLEYEKLKYMESYFDEYVDVSRKPLSLETIESVFILILIGHGISFIVFVKEMYFE